MSYDLFSYPHSPGFKESTTSREAALKMKRRQPKLCERVLAVLVGVGAYGMTTDECAAEMGLSILAIRPRFTELKMLDKIERTDRRRKNESGMSAIVWVAKGER